MYPQSPCRIIYSSQAVEGTWTSLMDEWLKKMWFKHTMVYHSTVKREGNPDMCYNMNKSWRHYANYNKLDTKGQIPWFLLCEVPSDQIPRV